MTPYDIIRRFPELIIPATTAKVRKTFQYKTTTPMYVVIDSGRCSVHEGISTKWDAAITISDEDLLALMNGNLNGMMAYMSGKLKVEGELSLAQKFPEYFDLNSVFGK